MFKQSRFIQGEVNILLVSTLMLGFSTLIFCILAITSYLSNQSAQKSLSSAKQAAYTQGQTNQHDVDKKAEALAAQLPFRNYTVPGLYGNFTITFPKDWNAYVIEDQTAQTQVNLELNPNVVKQVGTQPLTNSYAFRALLVNQSLATASQTYQSKVKANKLTQKTVTVSGISGTWYDGQFDEAHTGVIVLLPVRDKTLELITDTHDYLTEFNQILAQSNIVK